MDLVLDKQQLFSFLRRQSGELSPVAVKYTGGIEQTLAGNRRRTEPQNFYVFHVMWHRKLP